MQVSSSTISNNAYSSSHSTRESQARESSSSEKTQSSHNSDTKPHENPSSPEAARLRRLKATDTKVRAHEQAHLAAAGQYVRSGARFSYTRGSDGKSYATGGEVSIDTSPVPNNPEATLVKASVIRRAALAPADPSAQDRSVAAAASQLALEAQRQIREERSESQSEATSASDSLATRLQQSGALGSGDNEEDGHTLDELV